MFYHYMMYYQFALLTQPLGMDFGAKTVDLRTIYIIRKALTAKILKRKLVIFVHENCEMSQRKPQ